LFRDCFDHNPFQLRAKWLGASNDKRRTKYKNRLYYNQYTVKHLQKENKKRGPQQRCAGGLGWRGHVDHAQVERHGCVSALLAKAVP